MKPRASQPRRSRAGIWLALPGVVGLGALTVFVLGLGTWQPPAVSPTLIVAEVHGEAIPWQEIADRLEAAAVMGQPEPTDLAAWQSEVRAAIDSAINDVLVRHLVEGSGIVITDTQVDEAVDGLRASYGGEAALQEAMASMHLTLEQVQETQRRGLYYQALIEMVVPVSESDVDTYLGQPGTAGLSRAEAATRVRADRASSVIPGVLAEARATPGIWSLPLAELE